MTLQREIPLARPWITQAEIDAVVSVMKTPHLSLGPMAVEFERAFAEYCGVRFAVACSSGTAGLHLIVRALSIGPGDEVITTPFSFVASSNCLLMEGAVPRFVDVDKDDWNLDLNQVESAIHEKTKALLPVDVFGQPPDMNALGKIAHSRGLPVIEDSCEALGTRCGGKMAGALGDVGVFGFYPNKQITTGEGGMIVTNDEQIDRLCRSMRNQGRDPEASWLAHARLGYNYRLSDINCALGLAQLRRIDEIIAMRARVLAWYQEQLSDEPRLRFQRTTPGHRISTFVIVVRLDDRYSADHRDQMLAALRAKGIGCSNYFSPIHLQPFYVERFGHRPGDFPVCESLAARTIALPIHHELTESDVEYVVREVRRLL